MQKISKTSNDAKIMSGKVWFFLNKTRSGEITRNKIKRANYL